MDRRELLKMIALVTGGAVIGGEVFLSGCKNTPDKVAAGVFTAEDITWLDEVAETILPRTSTPGAKDAKVGQFMTVMVKDCYPEADQNIFREGMQQLDEASEKAYSDSFLKVTPAQRVELLTKLDKESKEYQKKKSENDNEAKKKDKNAKASPNHYFTMMKQLTLLGFFSSKEGATQALRYKAVPGEYNGCIDYKKGDKAWAT
ncbi:MAG: gluconate 2-dehydrogenase subunit 3 family protein [Gemmatimonadaceae bacterium]|nr:gluconate 2-dehydrogenase subunit 3 family protein [Chitinophagaceae bacterium]